MKMKKLGIKQSKVLSALIEHKGWQKNCGWIYDTSGGTQRVMDSLVKASYAVNQDGYYYAVMGVDGKPLTKEQQEIIEKARFGERGELPK